MAAAFAALRRVNALRTLPSCEIDLAQRRILDFSPDGEARFQGLKFVNDTAPLHRISGLGPIETAGMWSRPTPAVWRRDKVRRNVQGPASLYVDEARRPLVDIPQATDGESRRVHSGHALRHHLAPC
jgi:hypothetical protein